MKNIQEIIYTYSEYAHWIIFFALILAGFNVPISEDAMLITSGALASTIVPHNKWKLFIGVFLGCYLSDWIAYWIGRKLGCRLWEIPWFAKMLPEERYEGMKKFYLRHGSIVLLVGRFIPFGVRNVLFTTAGVMNLPFLQFICMDGIACVISNSVIFSLAYRYGRQIPILMEKLKQVNQYIFIIFLLFTVGFCIVWIRKKIAKKL